MTLIKYKPLTTFPTLFPSDIFDEFNKFFNSLDTYDQATSNLRMLKGFPKGDLYVEDGKAVIELALAGYSKDQLSVRIEEGGSLVVSASKQDEDNSKVRRSLARRAFVKKFPQLGEYWDVVNSDISFQDGLLKIVIPPVPKKEEVLQELVIK